MRGVFLLPLQEGGQTAFGLRGGKGREERGRDPYPTYSFPLSTGEGENGFSELTKKKKKEGDRTLYPC